MISPVCVAPLISGPPSSPGDTVIGPGVRVIVSRYVPVPSKPLSKLATSTQVRARHRRHHIVDASPLIAHTCRPGWLRSGAHMRIHGRNSFACP